MAVRKLSAIATCLILLPPPIVSSLAIRVKLADAVPDATSLLKSLEFTKL